jgi:hypothetical protein
MIIDHGKVTYAEKEPGREVTVSEMFWACCLTRSSCIQANNTQVSGADAILAKL